MKEEIQKIQNIIIGILLIITGALLFLLFFGPKTWNIKIPEWVSWNERLEKQTGWNINDFIEWASSRSQLQLQVMYKDGRHELTEQFSELWPKTEEDVRAISNSNFFSWQISLPKHLYKLPAPVKSIIDGMEEAYDGQRARRGDLGKPVEEFIGFELNVPVGVWGLGEGEYTILPFAPGYVPDEVKGMKFWGYQMLGIRIFHLGPGNKSILVWTEPFIISLTPELKGLQIDGKRILYVSPDMLYASGSSDENKKSKLQK